MIGFLSVSRPFLKKFHNALEIGCFFTDKVDYANEIMFKQHFFSAIHALAQIPVLITWPKVTVVCFDYDQLE